MCGSLRTAAPAPASARAATGQREAGRGQRRLPLGYRPRTVPVYAHAVTPFSLVALAAVSVSISACGGAGAVATYSVGATAACLRERPEYRGTEPFNQAE